jgi:hypothetical protein
MTTRKDLKDLVETRLRDAEVLLSAQRFSCAYYIAGYAVECAIKVVIVKEFRANQLPDKQRVIDTYQHNLERLMKVAGLADALDRDMKVNSVLYANWQTVRDWSEKTRYIPAIRALKARDILNAIKDPTDGVLQWLKFHW